MLLGIVSPERCATRNDVKVVSLRKTGTDRDLNGHPWYLNGHLWHLNGHLWHLNGQPQKPKMGTWLTLTTNVSQLDQSTHPQGSISGSWPARPKWTLGTVRVSLQLHLIDTTLEEQASQKY